MADYTKIKLVEDGGRIYTDDGRGLIDFIISPHPATTKVNLSQFKEGVYYYDISEQDDGLEDFRTQQFAKDLVDAYNEKFGLK